MPGPTQQAEMYFRKAYDASIASVMRTANVQDDVGVAVYDIAVSLAGLSKGLSEMAVGLRATYMKLEDMERQMKLNTQMRSSTSRL